MKVEYLNDISEGGRYKDVVSDKLIRLYDFNFTQARKLQEIIKKVILDERGDVDLSSLEFIRSVNCNLVFRIADANKGITTNDNYNFVCSLTIGNYEEMIAAIEPFCKPGSGGYQWLYEIDCPVDLLFSPGGTW